MNRRLNKLVKEYEKFLDGIIDLSNEINYFDFVRSNIFHNFKNETINDIKSLVDDEVYKLFRVKNYKICKEFYDDLFSSFNVLSINFDDDSVCFDGNGLIDYEKVRCLVGDNKPDVLLVGSYCYPRFIDYKKLGDIAVLNGCKLVVDISNIFDLVVNGYVSSPFLFADLVVCNLNYLDNYFIISDREILEWDFSCNDLINVGYWLTEISDDAYKLKVNGIIDNCRLLVNYLVNNGVRLLTDGSDNGIIFIDKINFKNSVNDTFNLLYKNGILVSENNNGIVLNVRNESFKGLSSDAICDIGKIIVKLIKEE